MQDTEIPSFCLETLGVNLVIGLIEYFKDSELPQHTYVSTQLSFLPSNKFQVSMHTKCTQNGAKLAPSNNTPWGATIWRKTSGSAKVGFIKGRLQAKSSTDWYMLEA